MRRIKLDNVYESPTPLENINNLWGDIDENTGELLAIHRYNTDNNEWEPYMVSVSYMEPDDGDEINAYSDIYFQMPEGAEDSIKQVVKNWLTNEGFTNSDELINSTSPVLIESRKSAYSTISLVRAIHEDFDTAAVISPCFKIVKSSKEK